MAQAKVIGVGLNKTATKSLADCLQRLGYTNHSYSLHAFHLYQKKDWDSLFTLMDQYSSFEDWPWPLMYREIDRQYPDALFILTTRKSADVWYRSLCKMAVRMGPLRKFEKPIYGYSMPQQNRQAHIDFYHRHNEAVREYFSDRPGKLLELCFDEKFESETLCRFLNKPVQPFELPHQNRSDPVYDGDNLWMAHAHRLRYQSVWYSRYWYRKIRKKLAV